MKELFGKFEYNGNDYAFAYNNFIITIVSAGYEYSESLREKECDDILIGLTKENNYIMFFGCKFYNRNFLKIATHITTQGCIVFDQQTRPDKDSLFDMIAFYSPAINDFFPPQDAIEQNEERRDFSVKLKPSSKITRSIQIDNCKMVLDYYCENNYSQQNTNVLCIKPVISFEFEKKEGVDTLKNYYLKLISFLQFINFNKKIPIEKIELLSYDLGAFELVGTSYINSNISEFDTRKSNSIYASIFTDDELASLFRITSNDDSYRKYYYTPKSIKDVHRFDHSEFLLCASCFEGLFKQQHPNFKAQGNKAFDKVKNDYLSFSNNYLENSNLSKSEKKYAEDFNNLISKYDGMLEEIFNTALKDYNEVISDYLEELRKYLGIQETNLGWIYAKTRNPFAHGDFHELGDKECLIYELTQALIYAIVLESAQIPNEKSKEIVRKVFM